MLRARGACTAAQVQIPRSPNLSEGEPSPKDSTRMFNAPGSTRIVSSSDSTMMFISPGSTRTVSPQDSTRMFRPAGSEESITIQNTDVETNRAWRMSYHFADALCIGQDEQRCLMVELWNYTEAGIGRMVLIFYIKWDRFAPYWCSVYWLRLAQEGCEVSLYHETPILTSCKGDECLIAVS